MAEDLDSGGDKTEEPSQQRIEEFRQKGDVASSRELTSVLILFACLLTLGLMMAYLFDVFSQYIEYAYSLNVKQLYIEKNFKVFAKKTMLALIKAIAPLFVVSFFVSVLSTVLQVGVIFAPEVLNMKFERLNPVNGFKRLFTLKSVVEAIKGIFKFILIIAIFVYFIRDDLSSFQGYLHLEILQSFLHAKYLALKLAMAIVIGLMVISIADYAYTKWSYIQRLKQTKEQAKRDMKEQEGDPEVRQRIRAIQREVANRRMMNDIQVADVVVTNPTHISVALKYDKDNMMSPVVLAKGSDFIALKIREIAKAHNVPIVENVPLARSLYATVKIGQTIPRDMYKAVAEVLAFVYRLKKKRKALEL